MRRCDGPCGRDLPASSFNRNGVRRRTECAACRRGAGEAARYEALRADVLARRIDADDPRFVRAVADVMEAVLRRGPMRVGGVVIGWDHRRGGVSRSRARKEA